MEGLRIELLRNSILQPSNKNKYSFAIFIFMEYIIYMPTFSLYLI